MKRFTVVLLLLLLATNLRAHDVELPTGFVMEEYFVSGLEQPTDLKFAPDGRIFIAEKSGAIRIVENGQLLAQPFYTVNTQSPNERGLVGIALDPDFDSNGFVYLMYTLPVINQNIVARVTSAGNTAIPGSEVELIRIDVMWSAFHNGGAMVFDQTGKLIIGTGDGTGYTSAQQMDNTLGKILRINPDGTIPTDNPFYDTHTGVYRAIAAYGLRNPYTMAVSPSTGRIFFNDVGNIDYEEVNEFIMGANYGWYPIEGPLDGATPQDNRYKDPIYAYYHDMGCAVVGASFYEPATMTFPPGYFGKYFFMDLCEGNISYLDPNSLEVTQFASGLRDAYNNLEVSPDGDLYLINVLGGNLARISYVGVDAPPLISEQPASQVAAVGEDVTFSVEATGEDLDYRWFRNGNLIQPTGSSSITISNVQLSDDQTGISVSVSNDNGTVTSEIAVLKVVDGSRPSIRFFNVPATYAAGDTITFAAAASDPDQQEVLPHSFTWKMDFHHDDHAHPALPATPGVDAGTYVVETYGEVDTNVFYRIYLKVVDSTGLISEEYIDVLPEKVTMWVLSQPAGFEVNIDGVKVFTDFPLRSVKNLNRTIQAPPHFVVGDSLYRFLHWEDGQDTMIRSFPAQVDTVSILYEAVHEYAPWIPAVGNLNIYTDTGAVRQFYGSMEVSRIRENWDVTTPYPNQNPAFPIDYWSGQWTGTIHPPVHRHVYLLSLPRRQGEPLPGRKAVLENSLAAGFVQEDTIEVGLEGGKNVDLRLEYDHHEHLARVELDWSFSIIDRHNVLFEKNYPRDNLERDDDGIELFPNPTPDPVVYLYLNPEIYDQPTVDLQVFDNGGRRLQSFTAQLDGGIYPLAVSHLPTGLYYLRIVIGEKVKTMKFIKD